MTLWALGYIKFIGVWFKMKLYEILFNPVYVFALIGIMVIGVIPFPLETLIYVLISSCLTILGFISLETELF